MSRDGIQWPLTGSKVSTLATGKKVWIAAAGAVDEDLKKKIKAESNWRANYSKYVVQLADLQAESEKAALDSSRKGIEAILNEFKFCRDGKEHNLNLSELSSLVTTKFETFTTTGSGDIKPSIVVPVGDESLSGNSLLQKLKQWCEFGSAESSIVDSVAEMNDLSKIQAALKGRVFVLLGATSAAGPARFLLQLGATIAAIARPGSKMDDLISYSKKTTGTLIAPQLGSKIGADVLTQTPEIIEWLTSSPALSGNQQVIGSYIYLDGEAHVRASVAMDLISQGVLNSKKDTAFVYLASPSTAHAMSLEAHKDSGKRYDMESVDILSKCCTYLNPFRLCCYTRNSRPLVKNADSGEKIAICNGIVNFQGPNYALAKTFQNWRSMVSRSDGIVVSANLAPPMYTESICHVKTAMAGLNGFQGFKPMAAFHPDTVAPILTLVLLWDLVSDKSTAQPATKMISPTQLFVQNSFHGGTWRCPYQQDSIGSSLFILGKLWYTKPPATPPTK
eukprot:TRINITY_DN144_c5_g1_i1.p1 TRINITY_DN144_c5_g1~~TRINITY_DN144_c5_g1_i1.p1  ORF type:complete len:505 (+),score=91.93 TRINITY_DN144_c5_g1_i1:117-1631(+)